MTPDVSSGRNRSDTDKNQTFHKTRLRQIPHPRQRDVGDIDVSPGLAIRSVMNVLEATAKALMIDHAALESAQLCTIGRTDGARR
jgi:hypothetical protein